MGGCCGWVENIYVRFLFVCLFCFCSVTHIVFNKDPLVIACVIIEGSRDIETSREITEFCALLFGRKLLWPSFVQFCSSSWGGSGLKNQKGGQYSQPPQELPFTTPPPKPRQSLHSLAQRLVFVCFMTLHCLLLSPLTLPKTFDLHEQKMLLVTFRSSKTAEKAGIFKSDSLPCVFVHSFKSKILTAPETGLLGNCQTCQHTGRLSAHLHPCGNCLFQRLLLLLN